MPNNGFGRDGEGKNTHCEDLSVLVRSGLYSRQLRYRNRLETYSAVHSNHRGNMQASAHMRSQYPLYPIVLHRIASRTRITPHAHIRGLQADSFSHLAN